MNKKVGYVLLGLVAVIAVIVIVQRVTYRQTMNQIQEQEVAKEIVEQDMAEMKKADMRSNWQKYVTASRNKYTYSILGGIYGLEITVSNQSDYLVNYAQVMVRYIKDDGDLYKTEMVDFQNVPAHATMKLKAPDSERGTSIDYMISGIVSNDVRLSFVPQK